MSESMSCAEHYKLACDRFESDRNWRASAELHWSAFCVQWVAVTLCAIVGRE